MSAHRLQCAVAIALVGALVTAAGICPANELSRIGGAAPWQAMAGGLPDYRLRIDDQLEFVYRLDHDAPSRDERVTPRPTPAPRPIPKPQAVDA